jgi:hypothetical protein
MLAGPGIGSQKPLGDNPILGTRFHPTRKLSAQARVPSLLALTISSSEAYPG